MTRPHDDRPGHPPTQPQPQRGYGDPRTPQAQYGAPQPYGHPTPPERPGSVIAAAILGFVFGAFGVIATLGALLLGAVADGVGDDAPAGLESFTDAAAGIALVLGLLALAWTVVMFWGSAWALSGRGRVLLLVGGSIALFFTTLGVLGNLTDSAATGGDVVFSLVFFLGALAIVVLLSLRPAADFFAAHRSRRGA